MKILPILRVYPFVLGFLLVFVLTNAAFGITNTKLNGPLIAGGDVLRFKISPDGNQVVYVADQHTNDVFELYSVPIGGGSPDKLNGELVLGGDVSSFQISPDSTRVVYQADQDTDLVDELYSVPIGGGPSVKLNGALVPGGHLAHAGFRISPNGNRVVYHAAQDTAGVLELYSVPIGGGGSRLSSTAHSSLAAMLKLSASRSARTGAGWSIRPIRTPTWLMNFTACQSEEEPRLSSTVNSFPAAALSLITTRSARTAAG